MATSITVTSPVAEVFASTPLYTRPTFLMCPPEWYGVDYVINPWMAGNLHRSSRDLAFAQWKGIHNVLRGVADVRLLHPEPGCPDMVFLGHGALVNHGVAALSSFHHAERRAESTYLRRWLASQGFLLWETPRNTAFEGEGDVTFDDSGHTLWAGHGVRTARAAHSHIANAWHIAVRSLHLVDPRFFHLDTCFAPLFGGFVMYYPGAFDKASLALIESVYPAEKRILVSEADAMRMACCALNIGRAVFTGELSQDLAMRLFDAGFDVVQLELSEFIKGGGGAKSMALRLSDLPVTHGLLGQVHPTPGLVA
ncbi:ornithine--oxo-acid transaminase [Bryocella elongata]|uniref:Ornithine--oxo-acid transaminase n=1 Tax=Bryocella elongata TaxID=863522 RepID=A0A1H5TWB8_9BACT|nr:arginine deiminase-related protein [Bryocella elongata]SEF67135.1 ornithine--oxo-acid transaminase [Bryocella elongata]